eukprot:COSAG01_NODE_11576_length_1901_cov_5.704218_3_plen_208_part_00
MLRKRPAALKAGQQQQASRRLSRRRKVIQTTHAARTVGPLSSRHPSPAGVQSTDCYLWCHNNTSMAQISLGAGRRSDLIKAGATKHVRSRVCVHRYLGLARIGRCSIASNAVAFCSRCLMRRSAAAGAEGSLRRDRRHHPAAQVREQLWAVAEAGNMARLWLAQNEVAFVPEGWEACRGLGGWGCCGTHQYTKASLLKISKTSSVPQ